MTNIQNEEENCQLCKSYQYFKDLVQGDIDVEEAFHAAFEYLVDNVLDEAVAGVVEDVLEEHVQVAHYEGYQEGVSAGMRLIAEQAVRTAEHLEEMHEEDDELNDLDELEEDCDCPDCSPELYADVCDTCDCEDECEDIEMKIRRRIWEDVE